MNEKKKRFIPKYYSGIPARKGDVIATGRTGQCKVLKITVEGELECRNLATHETIPVIASDCDLLERPVLFVHGHRMELPHKSIIT